MSDVIEWKQQTMQDLLAEIKWLHAHMKVIYAACGASCGDSVHTHRCLVPSGQAHGHVCNDCGFEWSES